MVLPSRGLYYKSEEWQHYEGYLQEWEIWMANTIEAD